MFYKYIFLLKNNGYIYVGFAKLDDVTIEIESTNNAL